MSRPTILHVGGVVYWVIQTRDPDTLVLKDADSTPTVAIRKNGASTSDSVTPVKRTATTGIYDCQYDPAGESEGNSFTVEESATVTGTTTAQKTYDNSWAFRVVADSVRNAISLLEIQVLEDVSFLNHFVAITAAGFSNEIANNIEEANNNWEAAIPTLANAISVRIANDIEEDNNDWDNAIPTLASVTSSRIALDIENSENNWDGATPVFKSGLALEATLTAARDEIVEDIAEILLVGINILPAVGIVADRSPGATITPVVGETISQSITLYATDGTTAINLLGKTLAIVFETLQGTDVAVVPNENIAVSGTGNNVVTFAYPSAVTASERTLRFAIRDANAPLTMYLQGLCNVTSGPRVD